MVDKNISAAGASGHQTFKEAVCIDVARVYDSCSDKDCLEDLRVYFNDENQTIVNNAFAVKSRSAELANVFVDVEPVQFNRGFYSVDITCCFDVSVEVFDRPCGKTGRKPCIVSGIAVFNKRVILYGSVGNVKVFTSEDCHGTRDESNDLPKAVVEAVDPIFLAARLVDADCPIDSTQVPELFSEKLDGSLGCVVPLKLVLVTLGLFSIVRLERDVQMLIPAYDFCIPDKECVSSSNSDPCALFKNIKFPINEFFPPKFQEGDDRANPSECGCGEPERGRDR
jgi:hypothetical protein